MQSQNTKNQSKIAPNTLLSLWKNVRNYKILPIIPSFLYKFDENALDISKKIKNSNFLQTGSKNSWKTEPVQFHVGEIFFEQEILQESDFCKFIPFFKFRNFELLGKQNLSVSKPQTVGEFWDKLLFDLALNANWKMHKEEKLTADDFKEFFCEFLQMLKIEIFAKEPLITNCYTSAYIIDRLCHAISKSRYKKSSTSLTRVILDFQKKLPHHLSIFKSTPAFYYFDALNLTLNDFTSFLKIFVNDKTKIIYKKNSNKNKLFCYLGLYDRITINNETFFVIDLIKLFLQNKLKDDIIKVEIKL